MIPDHWKRIAGLHSGADGVVAMAWLAHDRDTDRVSVYDCALFKREVLAVITEGIAARGRRIPIAWPKSAKEMADKLLDRGCNVLRDPVPESDGMAEMTARDMWERMRTGRFKAEKRLGEWAEEYRSFHRQDGKVPLESHPLMAATIRAVAMLEYARAPAAYPQRGGKVFAKMAIV